MRMVKRRGRFCGEDRPTRAAEELLAAGAERFDGCGLAELLPSRAEVCRQAGLAQGSFAYAFSSLGEYHADLVSWLVRPEEEHVTAEVGGAERFHEIAKEFGRPDAVPAQLIAEVISYVFRRDLTRGRRWFRRVGVLAMLAGEDELGDHCRQAVLENQERVWGCYEEAYAEVLTAWGRELRPPVSSRSAARAIASLADGYFIQYLFHPDEGVITLFEDSVLALLCAFTRDGRDKADLADYFAKGLPPK